MSEILLVCKEVAPFASFTAELVNTDGLSVHQVASAEEAFVLVAEGKVQVVVAGELLVDGLTLDFVNNLMKKYPLINCAMVSDLSPEDFHEATEGLGLFMQLPLQPGAGEAKKMLELLNSIRALMVS